MNGFKFRFSIQFVDGSKFIDGRIFTGRHECCMAAAEMAREMKMWKPVRRWSYSSVEA